ncbi:HMG-box, partial [Pholiota conissans]
QDPNRAPRPRNAFFVFRSYYIQHARHLNQQNISMAAAEKWNAMSDEEKWEFYKAADEERAQHKIAHPYY